MKSLIFIIIVILLLLIVPSVQGQTHHFEKPDIEFVLDLPSPDWQQILGTDRYGPMEFMNGTEESTGYLRIRKIALGSTLTTSELFDREERWELRNLPGYVACESMQFEGRLNGAVFNYEFVRSGRPMYGRIYYLQIDSRTFFALHFMVARDKALLIKDDMEFIAYNFDLKWS